MQNKTSHLVSSFDQLNLIEPLLRALTALEYKSPTPIQQMAIPILLENKDLLGCAQTGTGKTAAFALPILQKLAQTTWGHTKGQTRPIQVLILTPTRELAIQIQQSFVDYGRYLPFRSTAVFGGVSQGPQVRALTQGVDILIATPGRLMDLMSQRLVQFHKINTFVLDEADRMLDMGFLPDIKRILPLLPKTRQNLFFSATMAKDIKQLAETILVNPEKVEIVPESTTAEKIQQILFYVEKSQKKDLLKFLLQDNSLYKVIVFTRTKHGANRVAEGLQKNKITAEAIHGDKSQGARQRALENFKTDKCRVLIATDIAARGLDIDGVTHVVNYDIPHQAESYVHRIGRTGRAGASGIAFSFCDEEEKSFIFDIEKKIGLKISLEKMHPYHSVKIEKAQTTSVGKAKAALEANSIPRHKIFKQFTKKKTTAAQGGKKNKKSFFKRKSK